MSDFWNTASLIFISTSFKPSINSSSNSKVINSPVSFTKVAYSFRVPANAATSLYFLRFTASLSVLVSETIVLAVASSPANGSFKGRGSSSSIWFSAKTVCDEKKQNYT